MLLLPTGHYLAGGTLAVLASFFLVFLLPAPVLGRFAARRWRLGEIRLPPVLVTSGISFLFLMFLLLAGFLGSRDPRANPLPLVIWSLWWVGFVFLQALCGDLWRRLNPFVAPYRLVSRREPPFFYPDWLGFWPPILGFGAFAWFELIDIAPSDPFRLACVVLDV